MSTFGDLHVLVNNAGILRDRTLANMSEEEWDAVIRVHLKGHAAPSRHALAYWRDRTKAGQTVQASIVHTSSIAGYLGSFGQANYSAAKLAVVALSRVIQLEGARYGVRSNAVSPSARTRLIPGVEHGGARRRGLRPARSGERLAAGGVARGRRLPRQRPVLPGLRQPPPRLDPAPDRPRPAEPTTAAGPWRTSTASCPAAWCTPPPWRRCSPTSGDARERADGSS